MLNFCRSESPSKYHRINEGKMETIDERLWNFERDPGFGSVSL